MLYTRRQRPPLTPAYTRSLVFRARSGSDSLNRDTRRARRARVGARTPRRPAAAAAIRPTGPVTRAQTLTARKGTKGLYISTF